MTAYPVQRDSSLIFWLKRVLEGCWRKGRHWEDSGVKSVPERVERTDESGTKRHHIKTRGWNEYLCANFHENCRCQMAHLRKRLIPLFHFSSLRKRIPPCVPGAERVPGSPWRDGTIRGEVGWNKYPGVVEWNMRPLAQRDIELVFWKW